MYQLKRLEHRNLAAAIEKAEQYRALNEPEEAESICRDVLDADPLHQAAIRILGLALTDEFQKTRIKNFDEALRVFARLTSEYERVYFTGIAWERAGKAHLELGEHHNALSCFEHALEHYEEAERIGPKDTPDPVLRWNRCVRVLKEHPELVRASTSPHSKTPLLGD
jgi:tetratricopeptide (TPR) repeat protein